AVVPGGWGPGGGGHGHAPGRPIFRPFLTTLPRGGGRAPFGRGRAVAAARRAIDLGRLPEPAGRVPLGQIADPRPPAPDRETIERIEQAVARFPAEWRQVWDWWVQGERREEMARRAGRSLRTIQYWLPHMRD